MRRIFPYPCRNKPHIKEEASHTIPRRIASELGANLNTIETYYGRIKKKLHLRSGAELTRVAIQWRSHLNEPD